MGILRSFFAALLLACAWQHAVQRVDAIAPSYLVNRTKECYVSGRLPTLPMPLEFCHWYNENSCCNPGADAQALGAFFGAVDLGSGCAPMNQRVRAWYREVREILCMPCDPKEPQFRVRAQVGDIHLPGGTIAPDPTAADDAFIWRICSSFIYGADNQKLNGGMWGGDGTKFDKCGIQISNDCNSRKQIYYNATSKSVVSSDVSTVPDGTSCGTTFVVPSVEFFSEDDAAEFAQLFAAERFMNALPHWITGWKFQIVNDTTDGFFFNETPCFGRRAPDGIVFTSASMGQHFTFALSAMVGILLALIM